MKKIPDTCIFILQQFLDSFSASAMCLYAVTWLLPVSLVSVLNVFEMSTVCWGYVQLCWLLFTFFCAHALCHFRRLLIYRYSPQRDWFYLLTAKKKIMADKSKKPCQGKDTFERINFLYQAASQISNKSHILSCYYGQQCRSISKKTLQRM